MFCRALRARRSVALVVDHGTTLEDLCLHGFCSWTFQQQQVVDSCHHMKEKPRAPEPHEPGPPMYTVTLLTLSGSPSAEFELPPATSVGEILQKARTTASDGRAQLKLLLQGRELQAKETLCSLGLPPPPSVVELQLICQPRLVERISAQTSDYQRVSIGICGQRGAGKTSLMNQYVDRAFVTDEFVSVIPIEFKIANLRVERDAAFVPVKLQLWDLHGRRSNQYEPRVHSNMFRNMVAILFVADLDTCSGWLEPYWLVTFFFSPYTSSMRMPID